MSGWISVICSFFLHNHIIVSCYACYEMKLILIFHFFLERITSTVKQCQYPKSDLIR